jgi:hypothetical protein
LEFRRPSFQAGERSAYPERIENEKSERETMHTLTKDISPAELAGLIRVVQLARELQSSDEFKGKSLDDCVFDAACLIDQARDALRIVSEPCGHGDQDEATNN